MSTNGKEKKFQLGVTQADQCPACYSRRTKKSFKRSRELFYRCLRCRVLFKFAASEEEYRQFYQQGYYEKLDDLQEGIDHARVQLYEEILEELLCEVPYGKILDLGCGRGHFLREAQKFGFKVAGIEPSEKACASAFEEVKSDIRQGVAGDLSESQESYDAVTLWNVLDYCWDPSQVLTSIHHSLERGGVLYLRLPNSAFHHGVYLYYRAFKWLWNFLGIRKDPTVFNRTNFSIHNIKSFLENHGFVDVSVTPGKMTKGDPYKIGRWGMLPLMKKVWSCWVSLVYSCSSGRVYLGSNFLVRARKPEEGYHKTFRKLTQVKRKRFLMTLLALVGYGLALPLWQKIFVGSRLKPILTYHGVKRFSQSEMNVLPADFFWQLKFLRKRFQVQPLKDVLESIQTNKKEKKRPLALTFDDGFLDNYTVAAPLLDYFKAPATIFTLTADKDRNRSVWHLRKEKYGDEFLMSWPQMDELESGGIAIESHGQYHLRCSQLSNEQLKSELRDSKERIEKELQKQVRYFAYPYGTISDFDKRTENMASETGYEAAFTAIPGYNTSKTPKYAYRRIGVDGSDTPFTFRAKLNGALGLLGFFHHPWVRKTLQSLRYYVSWKRKHYDPLRQSLLISADFPPFSNGVSSLSGALAKHLGERLGRALHVIGPKDPRARTFDLKQPYKVIRFPGYDLGILRVLPMAYAFFRTVFVNRIRYVYAMNVAYGGLFSWLLSHVVPLQYVVYAYGYEFEKVKLGSLAHKIYLAIYRRSEAVIPCSYAIGKRLQKFGVAFGKIKPLLPGIDQDRFCKLYDLPGGEFQERKMVLTVGRLVERKGHDQVIRALPKLIQNHSDLLYVIVGDGPHRATLEQLTDELGLKNHVFFAGRVEESVLVSFYQHCELFVMPSRELEDEGHIEGFGLVFLEANACKKPVIGGRSGGISDAIEEGGSGYLVDPHSLEEITEKIADLLSNPEKAKSLGESGYARLQSAFSWEEYAKQSYEFLCHKKMK